MNGDQSGQAKSRSWADQPRCYGLISRALHWVTAALLIASFTLAWTWTFPGRGPAQDLMVEAHRLIGISILLLAIIRLWRRLLGRPKTLDLLSLWNRILAQSVHALILCALVLIPVTGWAYTNAGGFHVTIFQFDLPQLLPKDHYFAEVTSDLHEAFALVLAGLICLHVGGAIFHFVTDRGKT